MTATATAETVRAIMAAIRAIYASPKAQAELDALDDTIAEMDADDAIAEMEGQDAIASSLYTLHLLITKRTPRPSILERLYALEVQRDPQLFYWAVDKVAAEIRSKGLQRRAHVALRHIHAAHIVAARQGISIEQAIWRIAHLPSKRAEHQPDQLQ
jgi:hypothetical protein